METTAGITFFIVDMIGDWAIGIIVAYKKTPPLECGGEKHKKLSVHEPRKQENDRNVPHRVREHNGPVGIVVLDVEIRIEEPANSLKENVEWRAMHDAEDDRRTEHQFPCESPFFRVEVGFMFPTVFIHENTEYPFFPIGSEDTCEEKQERHAYGQSGIELEEYSGADERTGGEDRGDLLRSFASKLGQNEKRHDDPSEVHDVHNENVFEFSRERMCVVKVDPLGEAEPFCPGGHFPLSVSKVLDQV